MVFKERYTSASTHRLKYHFKISRYDVRKHHWVDVNIIWDDDWQEHENTEQFVLVSYQGWASLAGSSLEIKGTTQIGYDSTKKKPSFTSTVAATFDIKTGANNILRYNNQISRRSLLTHVVGGIIEGPDGKLYTYNDNGIPYTVRSADALDYYFKVNWTHVAN